MSNIPTRSIAQLPIASSISTNDIIPIQQSGITKQATVGNILLGFPIATQAEAQAGTSNIVYMTPLRTRQGIIEPTGLTASVSTEAFYSPGESTEGFFTNYQCRGAFDWILEQAENQSSVSSGGFRDLLFAQHIDNDTTNYTTIAQKVTMAVRGIVTGAYNVSAVNFDTQYKDLVAGDFHAIGRIGWNARGVSGIAAGAIQYGIGIASNEFAVENAVGGDHSESMAGVQAIIRAYVSTNDTTHVYRGFLATNQGYRITAGVQLQTVSAGAFTGSFQYGFDSSLATVTDTALNLTGSGSGGQRITYDTGDYTDYSKSLNRFNYVIGGANSLFIYNNGSNCGFSFAAASLNPLLEYDGNDYDFYDKTNNRLNTVIGGTTVLRRSSAGIGVGSAVTGTTGTLTAISPSTSTSSHLRLVPGLTVASPTDGDMWYDGTNLYFRQGGTTRTFTLV